MRRLFTLVLLLIAFAATSIGQRSEILGKCEKLFGSSLDSADHLYEVNKDFILHVEFEGQNLSRISLEPKYFHETTHPEWTSKEWPVLTRTELNKLMIRVAAIRKLGTIVETVPVGLISNMTVWSHQHYTAANVETGSPLTLDESGGDDTVHVLTINYFFPISGWVLGKRSVNGGKIWIRANGIVREFAVPSRTYSRIKLGRYEHILVGCFNYNDGEC